MNETIKAMVEALKKYNAGYIKVDLGDYSIIVADKETADFIENALEEDEQINTSLMLP